MADEQSGPAHRRAMAFAALAVIALLAAMIWVVQLIVAQQKLERCLQTGRRDCLQIEAPARNPEAGTPAAGSRE
ncbi:MAG: hypothetical protein AB7F96_05850 [Beijerinckiaceae bacterium]